MKLVFATNNPNKLNEIKLMLGNSYDIVSLNDINFFDDIPEPYPTLVENAITKAETINAKFGFNCFGEDTGLEIEALNGEPGVFSARYAGEDKNADANMNLVLQKLNGIENRKAQFKTVIALILNGEKYIFEGICKGTILKSKQGDKGFGYDPIFLPDGCNHSFAEMRLSEKNTISHRAKAVKKLIDFLKQLKT